VIDDGAGYGRLEIRGWRLEVEDWRWEGGGGNDEDRSYNQLMFVCEWADHQINNIGCRGNRDHLETGRVKLGSS
jgi:hypothetical protein